MNVRFLFNIKDFLIGWGLSETVAHWINIGFGIFIIFFLAYLSDIIVKKFLIRTISHLAKKTTAKWDDMLIDRKVFNRIAHLAPALVIYYSIDYVFSDYITLESFLLAIVKIYMIIITLLFGDALLNALNDIYETRPVSKEHPIKGYIQIVKIILLIVGIILTVSILFGKSPMGLLTGLGAMAAILMLVFKDTILGFIASIQLAANKMIQIGDWITMPKYGADGDVIEITLYTVKVQNFDKTITTIPTYALVSDAFTNWRGMEQSGGRRIKRHINIDMNSVCFLDDKMIEKFRKIKYLKDYIDTKQKELQEYNEKQGIDNSVVVNGRRLTNLGTFRKYLEMYLYHHPKIHNDMTFLVRQLQPEEKGIPIEVYVFSNDQVWKNYEGIQADIFDHILAIIPEFGLRVYQNPSGRDFMKLTEKNIVP